MLFTQKKTKLYFFGIFLSITCLCFLGYGNSLSNPFLGDDEGLIIKHPLIRAPAFWQKAFSSDLYSGALFGSNFYRPLQTLSFIWDYQLFGLQPQGFRLTNILLQAIVSFLVFLFSLALLKKDSLAFVAALLFATSPLHTEAVSYISGRADVLLGLFLLLSLLLFFKSENSFGLRKGIYLFLSWCAFISGLLSKELAVVFPLVILGWVNYYARGNFKKPWYFTTRLMPFLLISALYIFLRLSYLKFPTLDKPYLQHYSLFVRLSVLPKVIFSYFQILLLPVNLHMCRTLVRPVSLGGIAFSYILLAAVAVSCVFLLSYRKGREKFSFLFFWVLVFFLPQSGIFPINAFIAEHFIYLASISFYLAVTVCLQRYLRKPLFIISVTALVLSYLLLTVSRNYQWRNPTIFYQQIIANSPDSYFAHNNLGTEYGGRGQFALAIKEFKRALEIKPLGLEAHSNLADVYYRAEKYAQAEEEYKIIERFSPANKIAEVEHNFAVVYEAQGQLEQAEAKYKLALRLDPQLHFAHFNLARIYLNQGQIDSAVGQIASSLPEINLTEANRGLYLEVIRPYLNSPQTPKCPSLFYNELGIKLAKKNLLVAAAAAFKRSLELDGQNPDVHFNLGLSYWKEGLKEAAVAEFKAALKVDKHHRKAKGLLREIQRK
jgi:Flp pilus assembly protein TadD